MISVIISIYKQLDNLELIFLGLQRQSFKNFEVIIAEDDNSSTTIAFLEEARKKYFFPIKHVSQEDKGFRRCRILNKALLVCKGEKIVFLDGDCIPHKHFLKEYNIAINNNVFCCGRRVNLNIQFSQYLKKEKKIKCLNTFSAIMNSRNNTWKRAIYEFPSLFTKSIGIMGCNWGITKSNFLKVNGFDEDFEGYGADDSDINWRLLAISLVSYSIKCKAVVYHLYHKENSTDMSECFKLLQKKQQLGNYFCKNGIEKI